MENTLTKSDYDSISVYAMTGSGDKIAELLKSKGVDTKSEATRILNNIKGSIAMSTLFFGRSSRTFDAADRLIKNILEKHYV